MLNSTTQDCICSALIPLTRIHHTYLTAQILMRILWTFRTYALFTKKKFITENTCAQIFIDREGFVYVHHMKLKSKSGEDLKRSDKRYWSPKSSDIRKCRGREGTTDKTTWMHTSLLYWWYDNGTILSLEEQNQWDDKTLKYKTKHRRIWRRVPKLIWDFGLVCQAEI